MRNFTIMVLTLISLNSFASTNGGGVLVRTSSFKASSEIVFHMGQNNGLVKFGYAQLINKQWDIKEVTLPVSEISNDKSAVKALDESRNLNQWVELK